jgi:hypothetical protein
MLLPCSARPLQQLLLGDTGSQVWKIPVKRVISIAVKIPQELFAKLSLQFNMRRARCDWNDFEIDNKKAGWSESNRLSDDCGPSVF